MGQSIDAAGRVRVETAWMCTGDGERRGTNATMVLFSSANASVILWALHSEPPLRLPLPPFLYLATVY